ncbi:gliding motility protein GldN [bacterium SCSIO 12741]|nr:gliding motility protein GldN [bacterium SCSIO 12741]
MAKLLIDETLVPQYNEWGEETGYLTVKDTIQSHQVRFYEIKEEWFFDRQRSVLEVRIIGIKPVAEVEGPDGNPTLRDLFWVYFPEARHMFVHNEVYNRHNDSRPMTYDELFLKRRFESTIIKVSNTHDRMIADYKTGIDALLEAQKEEELIFNFEHDLWEY